MSSRSTSIAAIVTLALVSLTTLLLGAFGWFNYVSQRDRHWSELRREATEEAAQLSTGLALSVWNREAPQIIGNLESTMQDSIIAAVSAETGSESYARVRDARGGVASVDKVVPATDWLVVERPITVAHRSIGTAKVYATTKFVREELRRLRISTITVIGLLDLLLFSGLFLTLRLTVLKPLKEIERYALSVSSGSEDRKPFPGTGFRGELETVRSSLGKMVGLLNSRYAESLRLQDELHLQALHLEEEIAERRTAQEALQGKAILLKTEIADHKLTEEQLFQSQKMESIGRLAGGVAHDFNNMLSVILGAVELSKFKIAEDHAVRQYLDLIAKAARRSSEITRQLLAFSRKEIISPRAVNLNALIVESEKMLSRLISADIKLSFHPSTNLWTVLIDTTQVDQILMNLSVNASDAMPEGGSLTIETSHVTIGSDYSRYHVDARPGEYVKLTVSDTGHGMDRKTVQHIFEPFFTTKPLGEGTGLGLATVYGIVTQNNGFINVYSEPGQGTTFTIYLPRLEEEAAAKDLVPPVTATGTGTILLVEDEEMLLFMGTRLLEQIGYSVIQAPTPGAAISICEEGVRQIDLILTDVVMPGMNGKEMADRIKLIRPDIKVLFMSGYSSGIMAKRGIVEEGLHYIQKPLEMHALNATITKLLQNHAGPSPYPGTGPAGSTPFEVGPGAKAAGPGAASCAA